jgi:hypothetical protein
MYVRTLLEACRVAEDNVEQLPDVTQREAIRIEIDGLRSLARRRARGGERAIATDAVPKGLIRPIEVLAAAKRVATAGTRTEVVLAAWRDAESALSDTEPGSLASILACRAVRTARDAYHARIAAVEPPVAGPPSGRSRNPDAVSRG